MGDDCECFMNVLVVIFGDLSFEDVTFTTDVLRCYNVLIPTFKDG